MEKQAIHHYHIGISNKYSTLFHYSTYHAKEVGSFSIDVEGNFTDCDSATFPAFLRPLPPLNLDEGFDIKEIDRKQSKFPDAEKPLRWVHASVKSCQIDCDVITQKGVLKKIGYTINDKNSWKFEACKYNKKLYIRYPEHDETSQDMSEWWRRNSYWGVKFEEHMLTQNPGIKASYKMLQGRLGNKTVLLSAEVDAVATTGELIEVKTCFERKLWKCMPRIWLQSYLGKAEVLMFGWKNASGVVSKEPQEFKMADIPGSQFLKEHQANEMIGFLGDVLEWLYEALPDKDETWILEYTGGRQISLKCTGEKFLPSWYLQFIDG
ncbi:hypothetical protein ACHWQZ_G014117 [Mnemiopsis leidyi]